MNRVEEFKQKRTIRHLYLGVVMFSLILLASGLALADKVICSVMTGESGLGMLKVAVLPTSIEIDLMNQKIVLHTQYLNRDLESFKELLHSMDGKRETENVH